MEREEYFHVCTDGLSRSMIFRTDEDFINGMNDVAVCALQRPVRLQCFCLMSNHVHFVMKGEYETCNRFIRLFKRRINTRIADFNAETAIIRIDSQDYMKKVIAYVLRNPMAAHINITPWNYRWSSIGTYFSRMKGRNYGDKQASGMSIRQKRALLNSKTALPDEYELSPDGMIYPYNYVDYEFVERLYRSPAEFIYHLSVNNDRILEMETGVLKHGHYNDQELYNSMREICRTEFKKSGIECLTIEEKLNLAEILRKHYGAGTKQISRVTGIDPILLTGHRQQ